MKQASLQEIVRTLERHADAPALIAFRGSTTETWTFSALASAVGRMSSGLLQRDLPRGTPVAILAPNGPRWIIAALAAVNAGAALMPLDERMGDAEIARMLRANGCRWLVTGVSRWSRLAPHLAQHAIRCIAIDADAMTESGTIGWNDMAADAAATLPDIGPGEIAAIFHTSGTTGTPKAVPLTHANLLSNVAALREEGLIGAGDRALLPLPLHHVYPFTVGFLTPLAAGAAIVLPSGLSGPELATALRQADVTHLVGVPRLYAALLAEIRARARSRGRLAAAVFARLLALATWAAAHLRVPVGRLMFRFVRRRLAPRLRLLVSGGAALDADVERALDALGWEVLTGYGLTETSPILAFNRRGARRMGSAGRPLGGVSLRIAAAGADGIGQIEARGASVFAGYRHNAAATAAAFTPDGWLRTGDLGYLDADGFLHIVARATETIVLPDGKKVFPENVEAAYAGVPFVKELAVLARENALVALVVPDVAAMQARGTMRARDLIRESLILRGAMRPAHERFAGFALAASALPRTHLGKLRRHLLPALYEQALGGREAPAPAALSPEDRALLDDPRAAALWAWLQARFPDHALSLDTNPQLDLGIDSLGWVDLTLALERSVGLALTEAAIAQVVTLRDLLRASLAAAPSGPRTPAPDLAALAAPAGPGLRAVRWILARANRAVMRAAFHLQVDGAERIPQRGPCLICPNHVSYLDPFVVAASLPNPILLQTWWAGWTGILFTGRLRRAFSRAAQVMPVDPDRAVGSSLAWSAAVLAADRYLVWFPEGIRSADGQLQRFLPGVGALLQQAPVPVVPVYIAGTFAAWPRQRRWPRRGRVRITFGAPIAADRLTGDAAHVSAAAIAEALQARVAALAAPSTDPHLMQVNVPPGGSASD